MSKIHEILTYDNLNSYSNSIIEVGNTLHSCFEDGYSKVVIPSRGAFPFYHHGLLYYKQFCNHRIDFHRYVSNFKPLFLPFTADLNNIDIGLKSKDIRRFWVKLLADYLNNENSPYTIYYDYLVHTVGNALGLNTDSLLPKKNFLIGEKKFIFIDTAISGRAICEIIDSFDENNLKYFVILIVDNDGDKLYPEYKSKILEKQANGHLRLIFTKTIISEDTTPLLNSGICSVIFENLIEKTFSSVNEFKNNNLFGCGLWFINASHKLYGSKLNSVIGILHTTIFSFITSTKQDERVSEEYFSFVAEQIFLINEKYNILSQELTKFIIEKSIQSEPKISISNSHIARLTLDESLVKQFMNSIKDIK